MSSSEPLKIISAYHRNGHKLIVEYSDGTTAVYLVEQLRDLKQHQTVEAADGPYASALLPP
jgi:hypothetical protein